MFKKYSIFIAALTAFLLVAGCSSNQSSTDSEKKVTLTISAAASAQDALEEIQKIMKKIINI